MAMVRRVLLLGVIALLVTAAVKALPDLKRYGRLRSM